MNKGTINERVQLLINELGLNKNSFAGRIGVSAQGIGLVVRGLSVPSIALIEKILEAFPSVNEKWLLRGVGPMFIVDEPQSNSVIKLDDYLKQYLEELEATWKQVVEEKNSTIKGLIYTIDVLRQANQTSGKLLVNEKESAVLQMNIKPATMNIAA